MASSTCTSRWLTRMWYLRLCLGVVSFAAICDGKVWKGSVRLSARRPWAPVTTFAYDTGSADLRVEVAKKSLIKLPEGIKLVAILDEDWPNFLAGEKCELGEAKRWEVPLEGTKTRQSGEEVFYTNVQQMTAIFVQDGGSHVSYEDRLTTAVIPVMLVGFTVAAAVIGQLVRRRRREGGRVHPTLLTMLAALGMHWVFLVLHTLHLRTYAVDGLGYGLLDVLGELLHWGGQVLVSYVLVGLAYGWTLSSKAVQKIVPDDKSVVYLMAGCLGFVHFMLIILGRMNDDHYSKSHAMDSPPAYMLVLIRLALLCIFLVGAFKCFEAEQNAIRRGFIGRLLILGTMWFAATPILVLVAMVCAEYIQESVVSVGGLLAQSLGLSVLSWLFLTRNEYYKMSSLAQVGMLPYNRRD